MQIARYRGWVAALALALALAGCSAESSAEPANAGAEVSRDTVTKADPQAAVDEIYDGLEEYLAEPLDAAQMKKHFPDIAGKVAEYYGRISSADGGLCDVIILLPAEGERDAVRDSLHQYQEKRIREFENYDILGAFKIANGAVVFEQGGYIILLMLGDNDAAQDILDKNLPL